MPPSVERKTGTVGPAPNSTVARYTVPAAASRANTGSPPSSLPGSEPRSVNVAPPSSERAKPVWWRASGGLRLPESLNAVWMTSFCSPNLSSVMKVMVVVSACVSPDFVSVAGLLTWMFARETGVSRSSRRVSPGRQRSRRRRAGFVADGRRVVHFIVLLRKRRMRTGPASEAAAGHGRELETSEGPGSTRRRPRAAKRPHRASGGARRGRAWRRVGWLGICAVFWAKCWLAATGWVDFSGFSGVGAS